LGARRRRWLWRFRRWAQCIEAARDNGMHQHPKPLLASPSRRAGARATPSIQARGSTDGVMPKSD